MGEISLATLTSAKNQEKNQGSSSNEIAPQQLTFSVEERKHIDEIKETIDFMDTQTSVQYGVGAQRKITEFTDSVLQNVKSKDAGQVGELLSDLVIEVKSIDVGKTEPGLLGKIPGLKDVTNSIKK